MMATKNKQTPKKVGKPKEYGRASTSKLKGGETSAEYPGRECVLSFPLLKTVDNDRMLPRYSAILNRTEEDGVGMEDLDALQLELEALLSAVVVRTRVLQEEIGILNNAEEKQRSGDKKSKPSVSHVHKAPLSPGKRAKQERPLKKLKEISTKSRGSEGNIAPLPIKFTKVKSIPPISSSRPLPIALPEHDHNDQSRHDAPKVVLPKNDTPNKFWSSIEPYCGDLVTEDIKLIDELIAEHENDAEYQKVPPLGRHYSLRWAQEDLEEHSESSTNKLKMRPASSVVDGSSAKRSEPGNPGPLTQRLLSCLMEENIMVQSQESFDARRSRGGENTKPQRTFTAANASSLERRVRKELEEQGLLDPSEQKDVADDEILGELRRCQLNSLVISSHNIHHLRRVKKLATDEMARQELKKKLQIADNEVLDMYRKITAAKQKKKSPSKEEVEQVWKCLKDRELLLKQIDNM
ncbi:hypothetical protein L9F63_021068 [Diploptera punctata]|uniref:Transcriptional adapter 3 n=1 Tax=Diploptera punctata TaxID=6984 RepID=A0AAD7ZQ22_DIPPU|nr:hypothetical protein L9F63_021068 [Diploptera punctata]